MYQKKKNYVMAGAKYGIGAMHPDTEKQIIEGQIESQKAAEKRNFTFAAIGAGIGWFAMKDLMGLLIGGAIGYFIPTVLKEVEVVKDAEITPEPQPETPSHPDTDKEAEEWF